MLTGYTHTHIHSTHWAQSSSHSKSASFPHIKIKGQLCNYVLKTNCTTLVVYDKWPMLIIITNCKRTITVWWDVCLNGWTGILSVLCFAETREDRTKRLFRHYTVGSYDNFTSYRYHLSLYCCTCAHIHYTCHITIMSNLCHGSLKMSLSAMVLLPPKGLRLSVRSFKNWKMLMKLMCGMFVCLFTHSIVCTHVQSTYVASHMVFGSYFSNALLEYFYSVPFVSFLWLLVHAFFFLPSLSHADIYCTEKASAPSLLNQIC